MDSKCPRPFQRVGSDCVMMCPTDRKFVRVQGAEGFKCVYEPDERIFVRIVPIGSINFRGSTIEELQRSDPEAASEFITEKDRVEREIAIAYTNIDKRKKINDAFRDLQKAENARDESPEAYQIARTAYYTLIKGQEWINEERERVAKSEVEPEIRKYRDMLGGITQQKQQQQKTVDVVQAVKDKVLSLKDDFKYSVDTLNNQVEKLKVQINMENRSRDKPKPNTSAWIDTILNVLLLASLIYLAWFLYGKYRKIYSPAPVYTMRV
jgi:hypothetical protein